MITAIVLFIVGAGIIGAFAAIVQIGFIAVVLAAIFGSNR